MQEYTVFTLPGVTTHKFKWPSADIFRIFSHPPIHETVLEWAKKHTQLEVTRAKDGVCVS
jgi:hypothetical protein